jgi:signal transduction histidine kinase
LGGLISSLPLYFAIYKPGEKISRYTMSIAQMCFSALFIHLMDGRIEAHFHVFGSLAFIAAYRDWRLLVVASTVIIFDHFIRGLYFPYTLYGVATRTQWRWLEHAAWVIFEDIFLVCSCIQATKEMRQIADVNLELMKARLNAENLNIRRTQFFSVICHEIRTPLNGIIGFSDFLNESPIPKEQKEYVKIIKQCSDTLLKFINDLLDFSKIDSGRLEIDPHTFKTDDIRDYFENVFLRECQKKNLDFSFEIAQEVPKELFGDSHRIRQVLSNIVSNAIKFTESGSVRIRLSKLKNEKDIYRWDVEDTGIGIEKDYLPKIFSPYTQEYSSTARKYGGSGLGLSISKKLVELMGGQISVESTQGKGTVIYFTTPLK